jgi:hypothetical protein
MKYAGEKVFVADKEKAFADYVYYRLMDGSKDFEKERIDLSLLDRKKSAGYAKLFNKTTQNAILELFK